MNSKHNSDYRKTKQQQKQVDALCSIQLLFVITHVPLNSTPNREMFVFNFFLQIV